MQSDVELATRDAIETVQSTRGIVPFKDADLFAEMCHRTRRVLGSVGPPLLPPCLESTTLPCNRSPGPVS